MRIVCRELRDRLRDAARCCEHCRKPLAVGTAEIAHIYTKGHGGGGWLDIPANLVALGSAFGCSCHCRQHQQNENPSTDDLKAIVARRYKTTVDAVIAELDRALNQLHKGDKYLCPWTRYYWFKTQTGYEWGYE